MLLRAIAVAVPFALFAGPAASAEQPRSTGEKESQQPGKEMGGSVPGQGNAAGALGNSSDTTGAKGKGGAGTNSGTKGSTQETGAGETSSHPSGRWDRDGGRTTGDQGSGKARGSGRMSGAPGAGGVRGHGDDQIVRGRLSAVSGDAITIRSRAGERKLKIVPETVFTVDGKDAERSQLKEGLPIRASFTEQGGEQVAVKIEAGRRAGAVGRPGSRAGRSDGSSDRTPQQGAAPSPRQGAAPSR